MGTVGSRRRTSPPGETNSKIDFAASARSSSGKSTTTKSTGIGKSEFNADSSIETFEALEEIVSAITSCQFMEITSAQSSASYLLISRSMMTQNLFPGSIIRRDSGRFVCIFSFSELMGDHRSNSHADRWPMPPPMITAFFGLILEHTSLILALIDRGRSGMSMCNICSPMLDATSGSD